MNKTSFKSKKKSAKANNKYKVKYTKVDYSKVKYRKVRSFKDLLINTWYFIWYDNSVWSWIVNIVLSYVLIKFIIYPALGFILSTTHPVVAVVSGSMEHKVVPLCYQRDILDECINEDPYRYEICGRILNKKLDVDFDTYWRLCGQWYEQHGITKDNFKSFPYHNGFNTGDIMIIKGKPLDKVKVGDVLVFWGTRPDPIIHRIVKINNKTITFTTKGDHNSDSGPFEINIPKERFVGYNKYHKASIAVFRVPYLGYLKIYFVKFFMWLINLF